MANFANTLKNEIRRLARSEAKALTTELKKSFQRERQRTTALRKQLAKQKREIASLQRALSRGGSAVRAAEPVSDGPTIRWRKDTVAVLRKRHDLSQAALATMLGVGLNTVWSWEKGRTNPRRKQLEAIAEIRDLSKGELADRLAEAGLSSGRKKPGRKPGSTRNTRKTAKAGKTTRAKTKKAKRKVKRKVKKSVRSRR